MLQAALQVADSLTTLLSGQGDQDEALFTGLIDPIFRNAESVMYGYTSFHLDLIMQIYTYDKEDGIVQWLEEQRINFMPLCVKIRRLAVHAASERRKSHENDAIVKFKQGILGLLQGSVSLVDEYITPVGKYSYRGPTLLHQLRSHLQNRLPADRSLCIDVAKKHFEAMERAWEDAVEGYAAMKFAIQAAKRYKTHPAL